MATVREHYDALLAEHYSRMFGDFETKVAEQRALLERLGVGAPAPGTLAVDLGCGSGFQSVALARLGYRVLAIDFSRRLLDELTDRTRGLPVEALAGDIRDVARLVSSSIEVAVCMGDTLAHLEREADLVGVLGAAPLAHQRRHGRMSSGRGNVSGGVKTARYPSAGARTRKSTSR
jgi:2-polyprenyl-3-methyl-5-hydroxy-6-metoxy-1,4-benzoquinol methylase